MPSTFTLKVAFTGIVTLVPNKPFNGNPTRLCFLLVDGRKAGVGGTRVRSVDDLHDLKRHQGYVTFEATHLTGSSVPVANSHFIWYLDRQRLNFKLTHDDPNHQKKIQVAADLTNSTLTKIADLDTIAKDFGACDPDVLKRANPRSDVLAQVVFDDGVLDVDKQDDDKWHYPEASHLGGNPAEQNLMHEIVVRLPGLTAASIEVTLLGGGTPLQPLILNPAGKAELSVTIANLCDLNPFNWERTDEHINRRPDPDKDFKWHYQLLKPGTSALEPGTRAELRHKLQTQLQPKAVPHPKVVPSAPAVSGENCFSATMNPATFDE